jgi:hypothetical protein
MTSPDRLRQVSFLPEPKAPPGAAAAQRGRPALMPLPGGDLGAAREIPEAESPPPSRTLARQDSAEASFEPGAVSIDPDRAAPAPIADFYASIVSACADRIAMLARHRDERPLGNRPRAEERLLSQIDAILACGPGAIRDLEAYWHARRDDEEPYRIWPIVFTLACLDGPKPLLAIERVIESLPESALPRALCAADCITASPHPHWMPLALDLLASPHPLARVVGIEVLSRRQSFAPEQADEHLQDPSPQVIAAAVRALARHPDARLPSPRISACLASADPTIAAEAARALTLWGSPDAVHALRTGAALGQVLTPIARIEILVLAGSLDDLPLVQSILGRARVTPAVLRATARLGSAGAWSFLLHHLADSDLARVAQEALETVFGDLVPGGKAGRAPAVWREAIAERGLDPSIRYRRGRPWSPATVAAECQSGGLPRAEIDRRVDELRARASRFHAIDTGAFWPDLGPALADVARAHAGST